MFYLVLGGLLSAHLLYKKTGMELEPGWPCSGPLLRLAEDVARRILPGKKKILFFYENDGGKLFFFQLKT